MRHTAEAIVGGVTGSLARPGTLLLGRYDATGRFRYAGRTTPLPADLARGVGALLAPAGPDHPWTGRVFTVGWGSRDALDVRLTDLSTVVEVDVDVSRDAAGGWRHPVRALRPRMDIAPDDVADFGSGDQPAAG